MKKEGKTTTGRIFKDEENVAVGGFSSFFGFWVVLLLMY